MAVSKLDPRTALIVIDLQKGILSIPSAPPIADVVQNAGALATAFRHHDLPVALVNVIGVASGRVEQGYSGGALPPDRIELIPELDAQSQARLVSKKTRGAFTSTDLDDHLKAAGVTQVLICGVATSIGTESTARQAHELGFDVALAVDAMTDMSAEAHANSLERIFPRLVETGTAQEIIDFPPTKAA